MAQAEPDQRTSGCGGADEPDGNPVANSSGKHMRKEDGKQPTLKGAHPSPIRTQTTVGMNARQGRENPCLPSEVVSVF